VFIIISSCVACSTPTGQQSDERTWSVPCEWRGALVYDQVDAFCILHAVPQPGSRATRGHDLCPVNGEVHLFTIRLMRVACSMQHPNRAAERREDMICAL
jgi:hypothetical protein